MRTICIALVLSVGLLAGCGSRMAGTYRGDARLMEGKAESTEQGYSLGEVRAKIVGENRNLVLEGNGRFVWNTGDVINEGTWRVEGGVLYIRDDINDGRRIGALLQKDRKWSIGANGEIIRTGSYNRYNLEEVYFRE